MEKERSVQKSYEKSLRLDASFSGSDAPYGAMMVLAESEGRASLK